jgi:hypothetical protein
MAENIIKKRYKLLFYVEQNYSFDILRPLQDLALQQGYLVKWLLVGNDISPVFLKENEDFLQTLSDAVTYSPDAVFAPGDRVPSFIPGLKVQVFHGLNESKRGNIYPERGLFDLYCTEGPERTNSLQKIAAQKSYFKVVETGWVKLDSLFKYKKTEKYIRPQILFASTFTPALSCAELIYEQIKRLSQNSKWQWLVTLHPKMSQETVKNYKALQSENLIFLNNDKVIEALHRADVMICDNSSVFQEFLLLNKPVVTVNNREPLDCFINITAAEQLEKAIGKALYPSTALRKNIKNYGRSVTPYLDGESSQRVLSAVCEMLAIGWVDSKPKNIIRNLQMRKKLNYWKL